MRRSTNLVSPDAEAGPFKTWIFLFFGLPLFMSPISTSGASISKVLFAVCWLAGGYFRNLRKATSRPWFWPAMAVVAINLLGMLWTSDISRGLNILSKLNWVFFAVAGAALPWKRSGFVLTVRLFLAGLLVNAGIGALQWFNLYPWHPLDPLTGPVGYADHIFLSMALANALLWLAYDIKHRIALPRALNIFLAALFFLQLIITIGRAGQLAFVLLFPAALWMLYPGRWRKWAIGVAGLGIAGLVLSPVVQNRIGQGVNNLEAYQAGNVDTSLGLRLVFWQGALKMAEEHPISGVGTGDYKIEMSRLQKLHAIPQTPGYPAIDHPHNSYLAYLADLGLPGFLALLWFLWTATSEAWRCRGQPEAWFKLCYMGIFLLGSLTDTLIWGFDNAIALGIIVAIPACLPAGRQSASRLQGRQ